MHIQSCPENASSKETACFSRNLLPKVAYKSLSSKFSSPQILYPLWKIAISAWKALIVIAVVIIIMLYKSWLRRTEDNISKARSGCYKVFEKKKNLNTLWFRCPSSSEELSLPQKNPARGSNITTIIFEVIALFPLHLTGCQNIIFLTAEI